jgi:hypothetical protein
LHTRSSASRIGWWAGIALAAAIAGCATAGGSGPRRGSGSSTERDRPAALTERYRGDRVAALRRFRPARPAVDSGGECVVRESPMLGAGMRSLVGYFPTRADAEAMVSLTVDSTGRFLRYHERRGLLRIPAVARATTPSARDSVIAAAERTTRITEISLDRVTGEARAVNRGGGRPSEGVFGLVPEFETSAELGQPGARASRVAELCRRVS